MHLFRLISHSRWKQIKIKLNNKMKEGKKQKKKKHSADIFYAIQFSMGSVKLANHEKNKMPQQKRANWKCLQ